MRIAQKAVRNFAQHEVRTEEPGDRGSMCGQCAGFALMQVRRTEIGEPILAPRRESATVSMGKAPRD
jgi:hypothetical protein